MSEKKFFRREIIELAVVGVYLAIVIGLFTLIAGFAAGGFEKSEILEKNNFFIPYAIVFYLGIVSLKVIGLFIFGRKNQDVEGAVVHDPEQSPVGNFRLVKNPLLLIFFSFIVFSLLFWIFTNQQTFFNATPVLSQQFTTSADLFFSVYPASPSETLGAVFLIGLLGLILGIFVKKGKVGQGVFWALFIPGSTIISGLYGVLNHLLRYGFDEVAMQNVAIFWSFGGLITAVTGSMIPFLILHDLNNFFFRFSQLFSNDIITFITFTTIGILMVLFLIFFTRARRKKKELKVRG